MKSDTTLNLANLAKYFSDEDAACEFLEFRRWPNGPVCPHCKSTGAYKLTAKADSQKPVRKGVWKCKACRKQFTVKVGTIFEDSHIPLSKWLLAIHLLSASKKGHSAHQIHRMLVVTYKSAWFMMHRIRYAMQQEPLASKLSGIVEVDETYVGGKAKNMHASVRKEKIQGREPVGKAPVVTLVEREGRVKSIYMEDVTGENLKAALKDCIVPTAQIMSDESPSYSFAGETFAGHESVNHKAGEYVRGDAFINTAESVHALLKRGGIIGTYHHVSKLHLHRYLSEFDFRFNMRKVEDGERTLEAIKGFEGKRLMYRDSTKKD
jgi:transposase-like protein